MSGETVAESTLGRTDEQETTSSPDPVNEVGGGVGPHMSYLQGLLELLDGDMGRNIGICGTSSEVARESDWRVLVERMNEARSCTWRGLCGRWE